MSTLRWPPLFRKSHFEFISIALFFLASVHLASECLFSNSAKPVMPSTHWQNAVWKIRKEEWAEMAGGNMRWKAWQTDCAADTRAVFVFWRCCFLLWWSHFLPPWFSTIQFASSWLLQTYILWMIPCFVCLIPVHQDSISHARAAVRPARLLLLHIQRQQRSTSGQLRLHSTICVQVECRPSSSCISSIMTLRFVVCPGSCPS